MSRRRDRIPIHAKVEASLFEFDEKLCLLATKIIDPFRLNWISLGSMVLPQVTG